MAADIASRVAAIDWQALAKRLDEDGHATTGALLTAQECAALIAMYGEEGRFRSRVDMARHHFGSGEYQYFARPLPEIVDGLRTALYRELAPVASRWDQRLGGEGYPAELEDFLAICAARGQGRPTPLLLRYRAGDYNCLHQDLYGAVAFPLQLTFVLSAAEAYRGGELLLVEQRPRAQSIGQAISLGQGEAVVFANRYRPVQGTRGFYRAATRHGVSRLAAGERYTLGIIFHDAA